MGTIKSNDGIAHEIFVAQVVMVDGVPAVRYARRGIDNEKVWVPTKDKTIQRVLEKAMESSDWEIDSAQEEKEHESVNHKLRWEMSEEECKIKGCPLSGSCLHDDNPCRIPDVLCNKPTEEED